MVERRKVIQRETVAPDLELHVTRVAVAGEIFIEVRNYVPSLKQYGRGVTFPATSGKRIAKAVDLCSL
jgi:hypothetical protein